MCDKSDHATTINCFNVLNYIDQGSFGKVYRVKKKCGKDTNSIYALKVFRKKQLRNNPGLCKCVEDEVNVMKKLDHPYIIKLKHTFESNSHLFMAMEYGSRGNLHDIVEKDHQLPEKNAAFYMKELVLAVEYLHTKDIIHSDIKPDNIVIDAKGHVKLIDFGLAQQGVDEKNLVFSTSGTLHFMAPEMITANKTGYGKEADWWALGVTFYFMQIGTYPFIGDTEKDTANMIRDNKFISLPRALSENVRDLLQGMLKKKIKFRLNAKKIKIHPFFAGTSWEQVLNGTDGKPPFLPPLLVSSFGSCIGKLFRKKIIISEDTEHNFDNILVKGFK